MNTRRHIGKDNGRETREPALRKGHRVESRFLRALGLAVYVPSPDELRAQSDLVQPFRGQQLGEEYGFKCAVDAGTVLMRLIECFGLPNAPEYHDWSEDFMNFAREGTCWEYVFEVNEKHYFIVSHDHERLTMGCKEAPDRKTCEAFVRFIESEAISTAVAETCGQRIFSGRERRH